VKPVKIKTKKRTETEIEKKTADEIGKGTVKRTKIEKTEIKIETEEKSDIEIVQEKKIEKETETGKENETEIKKEIKRKRKRKKGREISHHQKRDFINYNFKWDDNLYFFQSQSIM